MKTFIYRRRHEGNKLLIGLIVARDNEDLFWKLDQMTDPHDFEVSRVTSGMHVGFICNENIAKGVAASDDEAIERDEQGYEPVFERDYLCDYFAGSFSQEGRRWYRFKAGEGYSYQLETIPKSEQLQV